MTTSSYPTVGSTSGAKSQNTEFFGSDLLPPIEGSYASIFRITLSVSAAVDVEVTLDSGSNWTKLNAGSDLVADCLYVFDVPVRDGDTFNMRIPTSGGATVDICRVDQITGGA